MTFNFSPAKIPCRVLRAWLAGNPHRFSMMFVQCLYLFGTQTSMTNNTTNNFPVVVLFVLWVRSVFSLSRGKNEQGTSPLSHSFCSTIGPRDSQKKKVKSGCLVRIWYDMIN